MELATLPYNPPEGTRIKKESLCFQLPTACCPVSKNPQSGSVIVVSYKPKACVLEVGAFYVYLHQYVGGLKDETNEMLVRDMEGMIMQIAHDCGVVLQTKVKVKADINLRPFLGMIVRAEFEPE